jgi:hypothetical protein
VTCVTYLRFWEGSAAAHTAAKPADPAFPDQKANPHARTPAAYPTRIVYSWHMNRERLTRQLDEAEKQVARSAQLVAEQWSLIARLEGERRDTATPRRLLALLEESRDLHMVERDRLQRMLGEMRGE